MYPKDRVVLNQLGRILFLQRNYTQAIEAFQRVLQVDAEDLQAHYSLMLAYRGAGNVAAAQREEVLFKRFKADESAQSITAKPRLLSVEDNNERQTIHDHENGYRDRDARQATVGQASACAELQLRSGCSAVPQRNVASGAEAPGRPKLAPQRGGMR